MCIRDRDKVSNGDEALNNILQSISYLIGEERKILSIASQAGDEVTAVSYTHLNKLKEKLADYSEPAPASGWEQLEKELMPPVEKKIYPYRK